MSVLRKVSCLPTRGSEHSGALPNDVHRLLNTLLDGLGEMVANRTYLSYGPMDAQCLHPFSCMRKHEEHDCIFLR
jgi:hypothetical protein